MSWTQETCSAPTPLPAHPALCPPFPGQCLQTGPLQLPTPRRPLLGRLPYLAVLRASHCLFAGGGGGDAAALTRAWTGRGTPPGPGPVPS